jgi:hypothetical protein
MHTKSKLVAHKKLQIKENIKKFVWVLKSMKRCSRFVFYFFPSIFFISVYFVLFSLISFCFRFISLISFRFVYVDFVSFRLVSFSLISFRPATQFKPGLLADKLSEVQMSYFYLCLSVCQYLWIIKFLEWAYRKNRIIFFFFISLFRFVFYFFPSIFFISVYFVLFSLISFCFRWFRFISFSFRWFRFVSFRFCWFRIF